MQTARKSDTAADRASDVETFYVVMNHDLYLHRDEEQYTQDYDSAARFPTSNAARLYKDHGYKVVGPCIEGEEP